MVFTFGHVKGFTLIRRTKNEVVRLLFPSYYPIYYECFPTLDPLKPLNDAETRKKDLDATKVIQAGLTPQQVQYEKVVLAFATTGAWGRGALAWRKDFLKAFNKVHEGAQPTMDDLDLDTNWNALSPLEYYTQRIAFSIAYHRAFLRVRRRWSTTTVTVA